ncbi:TfuA-related McrA-glycine thioamidation protein [Dickeya dianthicola]|uniref:TfuA-like protein n=1 Tax=Dickeya dianthicola TaxID=204039 RepID=UPI00136DA87B|nr:TfuA-like protein [Dickeya dianthicola]MCI4239268.1 TfuA domain-containing protein [Dickeya dianthicola]MCI4256742.1 TfuA domain-containing protein [Dickeya dianthicola]MZG23978.1 TfuA-related McrA-glycine thioamidation protein [Dickeya dianthicola]MZI91274.1 TfuA-related McrA-glycine thioamidation protein [Dickeya dianthicola]
MPSQKLFLFIGPTSYGLSLDEVITEETMVLPPVRRGDIQTLIESESPATIVIVDGTYHAYPAVSHVEIKNALKQGWNVWGMSSMGALRAAEMYTLGMRGYGSVFQRFVQDKDLPDDYVALVHGTESPWFPVSEPLVHIEYLLQEAVRSSVIPSEMHEQLMHEMRNMWFGYRTLKYLRDKTCTLPTQQRESFNAMLDRINDYRLKSMDVMDFFQQKPFLYDNEVGQGNEVYRYYR